MASGVASGVASTMLASTLATAVLPLQLDVITSPAVSSAAAETKRRFMPGLSPHLMEMVSDKIGKMAGS
jgi:hypothetical protein